MFTFKGMRPFQHNAWPLCLLVIASSILLFIFLGEKDLWTQEHRWADIVWGMLYRQDYLHPYLGKDVYYDKPLLSYWLIILFYNITHTLTALTLRLPSALAGMLSVFSIYSLGCSLKNKRFGLLMGWMLLTTFYFIFWARTSSADALNVAGILCALAWYFKTKNKAGFFEYAIFFIIIALTSLCKGLVGAVIPAIAIAIDLALHHTWKQHCRLALLLGALLGLCVYMLPFLLSVYHYKASYQANGLYDVYRENILRYFQPFDHQDSWYTYFIFLPVYLLPWAVLLAPALFTLKKRWPALSSSSKWMALTPLILFLFFTFSGSRRNYYILPVVPFALLFIGDWLTSTSYWQRHAKFFYKILFIAYISMLLTFSMIAWRDHFIGTAAFVRALQSTVRSQQPWKQWNVITLDVEQKLNFYLKLNPTAAHHSLSGDVRDQQSSQSLQRSWPILQHKPVNTIFITRKQYVPLLKDIFTDYRLFEYLPTQYTWLTKNDGNTPVAYIPITPVQD